MSKPNKPGSKPEAANPYKAPDDEVVHVPKGRSRRQFLLYVGLSIFTLIIYVVPQQFPSIAKPRPERDTAYLTWKHPRLGEQTISAQDFQIAHRRLESVFRMAGSSPGDMLDDNGLARILVLDELARD